MIEKIELSWLLSFHTVFEERSFKLASEKLGQPSSTVSRHIIQLEETLNVRLLERTTRRMSPTEAGQTLYEQSLPLLRSLDDQLEAISDQSDKVSGHLRILMPDLPFIAQQIASFCALYPKLKLSCETGLVPHQGLLDGFDLVMQFGRGELMDSDWVAKELIRWPSVIVASPEFVERHHSHLSFQNLPALPCITTLSALQGSPWIFKDSRHSTKVHVTSQYRANSANMAKEAAIAGLGMAILAEPSCQKEIHQGTLVAIELEKTPEDLVLYAYSGKLKYSPQKVTALLDHFNFSDLFNELD